ncbi:NCS2 family permease [Lacunimicrobium album]
MTTHLPLFVKRDLDGFFGLFIDNLVQLLLIISLCITFFGNNEATTSLVYGRILPGAAISILLGNIFYAWQAHRLAKKLGRSDITALPYGINTPSLLIYFFFVMKPVFDRTGSVEQAWLMGLVACLGSGLIEFFGAFVAESIRKSTPRAALLSTLAGIAIGFIAMAFAIQIYQRPVLAMLPMGVILASLFGRVRFWGGLPGGLIAVSLGTIVAWMLTGVQVGLTSAQLTLPPWLLENAMSVEAVQQAAASTSIRLPHFYGAELWAVLSQPANWIGFVTVIIPMGIFNVIGSLQNIESAEAAGDLYPTGPSLAANGIGTIAASLFGSCFPTTIYIGHPGWKALGARAGYSTLNGLVITIICLTGLVGMISAIIPMEAGSSIVLWIGIVITAQAFQATPKEHAPAVAMGLFPAIASWGATVTMGAFVAAMVALIVNGQPPEVFSQVTMQALLEGNASKDVNGFLLRGMLSIERGYIFTCMLLSAMSACLIDGKMRAAAIWAGIGAILALTGLTHAFQLSGNDVDYLLIGTTAKEGAFIYQAYGIALGYAFLSLLFLICSANTKLARIDKDAVDHGAVH